MPSSAVLRRAAAAAATSTPSIEVVDRTHASNGNGNGSAPAIKAAAASALSEQVRVARMQGYEGDACSGCGSFTMVRNGSCLKCVSCGTTSGCS